MANETVFRFAPIAASTQTTRHDLPYVAQSVEVLNNSNTSVLIAFGWLAQDSDMATLYDLVSPPWTGCVVPCQTDQLTVQRKGFTKIAAGAGITVKVSDSERPSQFYQLPQGNVQRPILANAPGAVFYSSSGKVSVTNTATRFRSLWVPPPNQVLGVEAWNFDSTRYMSLVISGDGTFANPAPTSGYADPSAELISIGPLGYYKSDLWLDPNFDIEWSNATDTAAMASQVAVWGF